MEGFKVELKKIEDWLSKEYASIHTGRATPLILDNISVENYGNKMPIKSVASVSIEDPKTLRVIPWDKSLIKNIEVAVNESRLGLSVLSDGEGLRVIFPMLTTENRSKLVKLAKEKLEESRISVRKERQTQIENLKNLTEDEVKREKEEIQKLVDLTNQNLENTFKAKEKDLMEN